MNSKNALNFSTVTRGAFLCQTNWENALKKQLVAFGSMVECSFISKRISIRMHFYALSCWTIAYYSMIHIWFQHKALNSFAMCLFCCIHFNFNRYWFYSVLIFIISGDQYNHYLTISKHLCAFYFPCPWIRLPDIKYSKM